MKVDKYLTRMAYLGRSVLLYGRWWKLEEGRAYRRCPRRRKVVPA